MDREPREVHLLSLLGGPDETLAENAQGITASIITRHQQHQQMRSLSWKVGKECLGQLGQILYASGLLGTIELSQLAVTKRI